MSVRKLLGISLGILLLGAPAKAAGIQIALDEHGNSINTFGAIISNDPGPGGLNGVLTYILPGFRGTQGDVTADPSNSDPGILLGGDILRFNGNGTLVIYSDVVPGNGPEAPGDTFGPPASLYANVVSSPELGPEGFNVVTYTPTAGQPGYDPNFTPSYVFVSDGAIVSDGDRLLADRRAGPDVFVSDGAIPEPSSIVLGCLGLFGTAAMAWLRKKRAA